MHNAATQKQLVNARQLTQKVKNVYHLVGKRLKVPFWDRVQKNRVLKRYFEKKINRVARSGAGRDPIAFPAKVPIGITSFCEARFGPNLEPAFGTPRGHRRQRSEERVRSSTSPSALMRRLKRCGAPLLVPALLLLLLGMHEPRHRSCCSCGGHLLLNPDFYVPKHQNTQ